MTQQPTPPAQPMQQTLEDQANASAREGIETIGITNRQALVNFVVRELSAAFVPPAGATLGQINQQINKAATEAVALQPEVTDTTSALDDSSTKRASLKDNWNRFRDWPNNASIMLLGKFAFAGLALFGLGAFYVGMVLPWWGQRSLLLLIAPALVLVAWAILARRKKPEGSIRLVSTLFAGLLIAAGGIFVFTQSAAIMAQTQSVHGSPVVVTGNLLHACQKVIPGGDFNQSENLKACANRLSNASKDAALSVPEKQAYRALAAYGSLVNCNTVPVDITKSAGKGVYASCANAGISKFYGPDVFAAIVKLDK